jgi:2-oxo-4-hydroxy-4-carboxy--5-ureidoimidazoline (OHCU) decarboxylase
LPADVARSDPGSLATGLALEALNQATPEACVAALGPLFEGAPRFLARLCAARPFRDIGDLFAQAETIALAMPEIEQVELLDAHPRLGAAPASVSALSFDEQGYDRGGAVAGAPPLEDVNGELDRLNAAYESRFGFRYCVFVAGRDRAALLPDFRAALQADRGQELARGLQAVVAIARDRHERATS